MSEPLLRRSPLLVLAVLSYVYDSDEPVLWTEIVDAFTATYSHRTIEATLYDAVAFGALHRIGKPGDRRHPDTRALRPTPLGQAWLDQEQLALPKPRNTERPET